MFNSTADAAQDLLRKRNPRDGDLESKLEEFIEIKNNYALCLIHSIPGHRYRFGSVFSDINHSSVLSYLNYGIFHHGKLTIWDST